MSCTAPPPRVNAVNVGAAKAGTDTLNFNHTSASYVFAATVSGNGTVNVFAGTTTLTAASSYIVLAATRSDRRRLVERSGFGVRYCQAAIIFSLVIGIASRNVCIGVLPKHQRP